MKALLAGVFLLANAWHITGEQHLKGDVSISK